MTDHKGNLRTCEQGHTYRKKTDCPTCPVCEEERKPKDGVMSRLAAPVRRALENEGIATLQQLSAYTERSILKLHGVGPSSLPKLRQALAEEGLSFTGREKEAKKGG